MKSRVRFLFVLLPLLTFVLLVLFLALGLGRDPREVPSPLVGKPHPPLALSALHDPVLQLDATELRGRFWLLNVWASWCTACQLEHPALLALAQRRLLPIYGLNYKDTREQGAAWLRRLGNPYEASFFDPQGRAGLDWGVYGVPETFLIDPEGKVAYKHIGELTPEVFAARIEPLLRHAVR